MALSVVWNVYQLLTDVIPSRLSLRNLRKALDDLSISEFYTYKTEYNRPFVDLLQYSFPGAYNVKYIDTLANAGDGYIVLPPTGMNSFHFEGDTSIIEQGNFSRDPVLTAFQNSNSLERIAERQIKTLGLEKTKS